MAVGELSAKVLVADRSRIHYGPNDPLMGKVVINYRNSSTKEPVPLFGPCSIQIILKGCITIRSKSHHDEYGIDPLYRHGKVICSRMETIHDGPITFNPGESTDVGFSICFPEYLDPSRIIKTNILEDEAGKRRFLNEVVHLKAEKLPPSLGTLVHGISHDKGLIVIEYMLETSIEMPGIPIKIAEQVYKPRVLYEQNKISQFPRANENYMSAKVEIVSNKFHPETDQKQGFTGLAKSILRSSESRSLFFELFCTGIPDQICQGQILSFQVGIRMDHERSTVLYVPDIVLSGFDVAVVAMTRIERNDPGSTERRNDLQICKSFTSEISPPGPFSKATDYVKMVRTTEPINDVPSTFSLSAITRSYKLQVKMHISVGGEERHIHRDFPVVIYPPILGASETTSGEAGPSSSAGMDHEELPPAYEAVMLEESPPKISDELR